MAERVIPLADHRYLASLPAIPATLAAPTGVLLDRLQRPLHDLSSRARYYSLRRMTSFALRKSLRTPATGITSLATRKRISSLAMHWVKR